MSQQETAKKKKRQTPECNNQATDFGQDKSLFDPCKWQIGSVPNMSM